jgi:hypothetical protein
MARIAEYNDRRVPDEDAENAGIAENVAKGGL